MLSHAILLGAAVVAAPAAETPAVYVGAPESVSGVVVVGARPDRQSAASTIAARLTESGAVRTVRVPEAAHVRVDVFALDVEANRGYVAKTRVTAAATVLTIDGRCGMGCVTQDRAAAWESAAADAALRIQQWIAENRDRVMQGSSAAAGPAPASGAAGVALSLTPGDLAAAITASVAPLDEVLAPYRLSAPLPANKPPLTVIILTPWARTAEWASGLRETGGDPEQTRAPRAVLEASITVVAEPASAGEAVRHMMELRGGRVDHDARITPLQVGEGTGRGGRTTLTAVFGPEVLDPGTELRFVMADGRQAAVRIAEDWVRGIR